MTTTTHTDHAAAPAGPPKLTPAQLRAAQAQTLDAPRLRYSLLARALFTAMDLAYGRSRTLVKFTMLEFIARVPYQAWERIGYLALARHRRRSALARRVFERIVQTRAEQDKPNKTKSSGTRQVAVHLGSGVTTLAAALSCPRRRGRFHQACPRAGDALHAGPSLPSAHRPARRR